MTSHILNRTRNEGVVPHHSTLHSRGPAVLSTLAALTVILAMIGLSSCSGYTSSTSIGGNPGGGTTGDPQTGILSPSSASVAFGNVNVGSTSTQSVTVTNTGTAVVNIASADITGTGFTVVGGNPSASVPVGQSATV